MGVRIRRWPAQLASRALATLHPVAASGREGQVKPDRSGEPLESHRSEGLEADSVGLGSGYLRIADATCSATTLRRRRDEWITLGLAERLRLAVLGANDRLLGLKPEQLAVDGSTIKAPYGGQVAGPSPVDRRNQGLKRPVATDAGSVTETLAVSTRSTHHTVVRQRQRRRWPAGAGDGAVDGRLLDGVSGAVLEPDESAHGIRWAGLGRCWLPDARSAVKH
jgi:hypothetical protein